MVRSILERMWRSEPRVVSASEGYARWAPLYPPCAHNPLMEAEALSLGRLIAGVGAKRALDVGTGTGRNVELLRETATPYVVGIDLSPAMLACGGKPFPRVCGDAHRLPFRSESFDLVCSSLMCGDIADLGAWIREAGRVVQPGGHVVYSDFHPSWSTSGWRRTFKGADGRTYQLPLFPHSIEQHLELLEQHGLEVRAVREPAIAGDTTPVVVVLHAIKWTRGHS